MKRRPRRTRAINRTLIVAAIAALGAAGSITVARADTVAMSGVFGFQPDYAKLGLCPCPELKHPVMPWSVPTITRQIEQWANTADAINPTATKRALTYSLSTVGALDYIDQPDAKPIDVWAFGSPETPRKGRDRAEVAPQSRENVTFVVALYDPIADPMSRWNIYAAINERLSTHLHGYDDLDLANPHATYTAPDGSTTLYYAPEVLPMLKSWDWLLSDERMAELDAKYRPRVEAAYDRPVEVPVPSGPEPEALRDNDEEESWSDQKDSSLSEPLDDGESSSETDGGELSTQLESVDQPSTRSSQPHTAPQIEALDTSAPSKDSASSSGQSADDWPKTSSASGSPTAADDDQDAPTDSAESEGGDDE